MPYGCRVRLATESWLQLAGSCPQLQQLRGGAAGKAASAAFADALPSVAPQLAVSSLKQDLDVRGEH